MPIRAYYFCYGFRQIILGNFLTSLHMQRTGRPVCDMIPSESKENTERESRDEDEQQNNEKYRNGKSACFG